MVKQVSLWVWVLVGVLAAASGLSEVFGSAARGELLDVGVFRDAGNALIAAPTCTKTSRLVADSASSTRRSRPCCLFR